MGKVRCNPHDGYGHAVHRDVNHGEKRAHHAVCEEVDGGELAVHLVETPLLAPLGVECAHDKHAVKPLSRHAVDLVYQRLQPDKFRLYNRHKHGNRNEHHRHGGDDYPQQVTHVGGQAHGFNYAADCHDGRVHDHAHQHNRKVLDLRDVVGAARDKRRHRKPVDVGSRKPGHLREQIAAQVARCFRAENRRDVPHGNSAHGGRRRIAQHYSAVVKYRARLVRGVKVGQRVDYVLHVVRKLKVAQRFGDQQHERRQNKIPIFKVISLDRFSFSFFH